MKKNLVMRIAAVVLMCTLVTACFASSTFAKYTSAVNTESSTVTVAKWDIKAGEKGSEVDITGSNPTVAFKLFDTIVDTVDGNTDLNVAGAKIAPGTKGEFVLSIKNDSEVDATYTLKFAETQTNMPEGKKVPILYSIDNGTNWKSAAELSVTDEAIAKNGGQKDVTVQWKWNFTDGSSADAIDTAIGIAAQNTSAVPSISVAATITVDQVD